MVEFCEGSTAWSVWGSASVIVASRANESRGHNGDGQVALDRIKAYARVDDVLALTATESGTGWLADTSCGVMPSERALAFG